jgi:hypothetical protein
MWKRGTAASLRHLQLHEVGYQIFVISFWGASTIRGSIQYEKLGRSLHVYVFKSYVALL